MSFNYLSDWMPSGQACAVLHCSPSTLWRMRASGLLRPGIHWTRVSPGGRAPVLYNAPAIALLRQVACSR